jgi:ELWxxDGT repeat protein
MNLRHALSGSATACAIALAAAVHAAPFLVREIDFGTRGSHPDQLTQAGGLGFFTTSVVGLEGYTSGSALWRTDGTEPGTMLLTKADDAYQTPLGSSTGTLFFERDGAAGVELWMSNGTPEGTRALATIDSRRWQSDIAYVASVNGRELFLALPGGIRNELWASDGTPEGTRRVADVQLPWQEGSKRWEYAALDDRVVFTASDSVTGSELWASDATSAGTGLILDVYPGPESSNPSELTALGGKVFFSASGPSGVRELWVTDGTAEGTTQVSQIGLVDRSAYVRGLHALDGAVYFLAGSGASGSPVSLWRSDGTRDGTAAVAMLPNSPSASVRSGSRLFFPLFGEDFSLELWSSDGSTTGTVRIVSGMAQDRMFLAFTEVGGATFFAACVEFDTCQLWRTDGTSSGSWLVTEFDPGTSIDSDDDPHWHAPELASVGGTLVYSVASNTELWTTDGTTVGTRRLESGGSPAILGSVGDVLFLSANDRASGRELWKTDGSEAGTVRVADLEREGNGSSPTDLTQVGSMLFFAASDLDAGNELWRSDGTESGTTRVADINPGWIGAHPTQLIDVNGTLFFTAHEPTAGRELWRSDGSAAGTARVVDLTPGPDSTFFGTLANIGGSLFFLAVAQHGGWALWKSDGTAAGTTLVTEVQVYPTPWTCSCVNNRSDGVLLDWNGLAAFMGHSPNGCEALWRSDGTPAGTVMLREFCEVCFRCVTGFTSVADSLVFTAYNDVFRSDGTAGGTMSVGWVPGSPHRATRVGDAVYLAIERELWRTDLNGTERVQRFESFNVTDLAEVSGTLLFTTANHPTAHLWASNGTAEGTAPVAPVLPTWDHHLTGIEGLLFFAAGTHGTRQGFGEELWVSDGTRSGTRRVSDINPGPGHAMPAEMTRVGDLLFFTADDRLHGRQLWALPLCEDGMPCPSESCDRAACDDSDPCTLDWCRQEATCMHTRLQGCRPRGTTTTTLSGATSTTTLPPQCGSARPECTRAACGCELGVCDDVVGVDALRCALGERTLELAACSGEDVPPGLVRRLHRVRKHLEATAEDAVRTGARRIRRMLGRARRQVAMTQRGPNRIGRECAEALNRLIAAAGSKRRP